MKNRQMGFTLMELLVVVAIIGVLIAILLPGLGKAREMSRAAACLSNMRQWGIGALSFAQQDGDRFPWEGEKNDSDMPGNFASPIWWANAIPPMLGQTSYATMSDNLTGQGKQVPLPPEQNIFIDPCAKIPSDAPYSLSGKRYFFCYVWNSQFDNTVGDQMKASGINDPIVRMKPDMVSQPSDTILMLEIRTVKDELPIGDPHYTKPLDRHRTDWKRFAARHRAGGHMTFVDGHASWVSNEIATTSSSGNRVRKKPTEDWNKPTLIWDPVGPAYDN